MLKYKFSTIAFKIIMKNYLSIFSKESIQAKDEVLQSQKIYTLKLLRRKLFKTSERFVYFGIMTKEET